MTNLDHPEHTDGHDESPNHSRSRMDEMELIIKQLMKRNRRLEFAVERLKKDKEITEGFLNATIKDLEVANEKIKEYSDKEIQEKERTIRFQQTRLNQITDAMPYSMAYVDLDFRYQLNNKSYQKWFGKGKKDLIGLHIKEIIGEEAFLNYSKPLLEQTFKGEEIHYDIKLKNKSGKKLILNVYYIPALDEENNIIGAYVYAQDITEIKENEIKIEEKNKELQHYIESNLQLENFAYLASHDLKSPLNNVLNFSRLLSHSAKEKLDEKEQKFLGFIQDGSLRMQQFIEDLLAYSVSSNKEVNFSSIPLKELLDEILRDNSLMIESNEAKICMCSIPEVIQGDTVLIKQLFFNLISNACKFIPKDRTPKIVIHCEEREDEYEFYVKDNGIGINHKDKQLIFGLFKRLHLRSEFDGTGIGLSTCRNAVEKHGGRIWIESEEGFGSTFYFTIAKNGGAKQNNPSDG